MNIQYVPIPGNDKAVDMIVDGLLIQEDIPYIPALATDHRGAALYFFLLENSDPNFPVGIGYGDTENIDEIARGYEYMFNPKHVREAFLERQNISKSRKKKY